MKPTTLKSDALLLFTAAIWGLGFVAQRKGMEYVEPFTFNGVRFALGCLVLVPFILWNNSRIAAAPKDAALTADRRTLLIGGGLAGLFCFAGASLQQVGLVYTTAGKAGFITGLYVVIVPILGLFWKQRPPAATWLGAVLAVAGLYLLSVTEGFAFARGDLFVLIGAFVWAGHVLILGRFSPVTDPLKLAFTQFAVCSFLSIGVAVATETIEFAALLDAAVPVFYGGAVSVGVAYTLQIVAQRRAPPAHVAILLSLEAVFAALGGWLILGEVLSTRGLAGCGLMLGGMLFSQLWGMRAKPSQA